jgi:plastocyanin
MKRFLVLTLCLAGALSGCAKKPPSERINITMKKYEFMPPEVHVKRGQRVLFVINSLDTQHGFHCFRDQRAGKKRSARRGRIRVRQGGDISHELQHHLRLSP